MSLRAHRARQAGVAVLALVVLLAVLLFVREYQATDDGRSQSPGGAAAPDPAGMGVTASRTPSPASSGSGKPGNAALVIPGGPTLTLGAGPGLVVDFGRQLKLSMKVTSTEPITGVGYLAPTSKTAPKAIITAPGRSWGLNTTVTGNPHYALVFVQATASGAPVTCSIAIDGKVLDTKTTSGPYARQVCYA